jgi:hypothetical protein
MSSWTETRFLTEFTATDDTGQQHTLNLYAEFYHFTPLAGAKNVRQGMFDIEAEDGSKVNHLGGGKFQVVSTGLLLHSADPRLPPEFIGSNV